MLLFASCDLQKLSDTCEKKKKMKRSCFCFLAGVRIYVVPSCIGARTRQSASNSLLWAHARYDDVSCFILTNIQSNGKIVDRIAISFNIHDFFAGATSFAYDQSLDLSAKTCKKRLTICAGN